MHFDLLVVGTGLYGSTIAHKALEAGKSVLMLEKRNHIGGNIYTEDMNGIHVHRYGAHIFHTNNRQVWDYIQSFASFNRYTHSPIINFHGQLYPLPFNMSTFYQMWGVTSPRQAEQIILQQRKAAGITTPQNLEEQAIALVGSDIYQKLIKGYTEKQWGRPCSQLPPSIIRRIPVRFTFDNNYFDAAYQGIPIGGYTKMISNMLKGAEIRLNTDYLIHRDQWNRLADRVVFTGPIDAFFGFRFGPLAYRSIRFEMETLDITNYQGVSVVNYSDCETPFTRIIEHKWFDFMDQAHTIISREYSSEWAPGDDPFYPVNDAINNKLYLQYKELAALETNVVFGGRLGEYRYYDMDQVVESALSLAETLW